MPRFDELRIEVLGAHQFVVSGAKIADLEKQSSQFEVALRMAGIDLQRVLVFDDRFLCFSARGVRFGIGNEPVAFRLRAGSEIEVINARRNRDDNHNESHTHIFYRNHNICFPPLGSVQLSGFTDRSSACIRYSYLVFRFQSREIPHTRYALCSSHHSAFSAASAVNSPKTDYTTETQSTPRSKSFLI